MLGLDRLKLLTETVSPDPTGRLMFAFVIASYEGVANIFDIGMGIVPWDLCGLDESHEIKSTYAKIHKTAWRLRDVSRMRVAMTGTPVTNTLLDLYTQLEFLGRGFSGFISWKGFKNFYARYERNEYTGRDELKEFRNLPFLQERLSRLAFMISIKQAMPWLPKQNWDVREVTLTKRQKELYKQMQQRIIEEIDAKAESGSRTVTADCILTMLLRLSQITSGFVSWDPVVDEGGELLQPKKIEVLAENPKLELLIEELKAMRPDQKALVWSCWVPSLQLISARLVKEGINHGLYYGQTPDKTRAAIEYDFNNSKEMRVFLGNPSAGGVGLNLWGYEPDLAGTAGDTGMNADLAIVYDENWSMVVRSQAEGRNFRRGTRVPVTYRTLVAPGTVDQEIYDRVIKKITDATDIQDVRKIMERVLQASLYTND